MGILKVCHVLLPDLLRPLIWIVISSEKDSFDNKTSSGVIEVMADVNVIGSLEAKFESTNRIYDVGGV